MLERRAIVLALVLAVHALAVLALLVPHRHEVMTADAVVTTILFFVPPAEPEANARNHPSPRLPRTRRVEPSPVADQTPHTIPDEPPPPSPIDWRTEGAKAATNILQENDQAARRRAALEPHGGIQLGESTRPPPGIAWDIAHTRRIEPLAEGGTLIRLNDRCVIVFPFMLPFCKVGKIEPRGDLFKHMNELPDDLTRPSIP